MFAMVSVAPSVAVASVSLADGRAAVPFPMSSVTLTGDWKHAQDANQEVGATCCAFRLTPPPPSLTTVPRAQVLMGLNFSQLTCHFTSTANLTACQSPATQWHAYTRDAEASTAAALFDVSAGFLGAGDDARAPAELSVAGCEATCAGLASCRGFTFQVGSARAGVSSALIANPRSLGARPAGRRSFVRTRN